jgi:ABC-type lipoprotein release transport system permease subunit
MKLVLRSLRNVLRSPVRLLMVVALLGGSLTFVAAMVSLHSSSQQQISAVRQQIGTTITIESTGQAASSPGNGPSLSGASPTAVPTAISGPGGNTSIVLIPPAISNTMAAKVKGTQGVASVQEILARPYTEGNLQSTSTGLSLPIMLNGVSLDSTSFTLSGGAVPTLVAGRGFRASDVNTAVAMMSQALAKKNDLKVGSTFTLSGTTFTLIGLYTTSSQTADNSVAMPLTTMQTVYQLDGVDTIHVTAVSLQQVEAVASRLRDLLGTGFNVVAQADQYNNVFAALQVAQNSIQAALLASFFIAAAVIVFAVLMLVRERIAEIAILKTIGASHLQILRQFWTEILALSSMASVLAILLLVTLGPVLAHLFDIDAASLIKSATANSGPSIDHPLIMTNGIASTTTTAVESNLSNIHLAAATLNAQTLLIILGVGIGLALLTSLIPTWFVARLKPAEVLRKAS